MADTNKKTAIDPLVSDAIKSMELDWWIYKLSRAKARKQLEKKLGGGVKISVKAFADMVSGCCVWYGARKRARMTLTRVLDEYGWEKLGSAVGRCLDLIQGRSLDEACEIVRAFHPCNRYLLQGLPNKYHVWKVPGKT